MSPLEFRDYKQFFNKRLRVGGRGQLKRLAEHLNIHTSLVSQILKGAPHFTGDQALGACDYLGLSPIETDYVVLMVQRERAGTPSSRRYYDEKLRDVKEKAQDLSARLQVQTTLTEGARAQYYSAWYYGGIRLLTATEKFNEPQSIARKLDLPVSVVTPVIQFLLDHQLLEIKGGHYSPGNTSTYIGRDSLLLQRHHLNWRSRMSDQIPHAVETDLHYTHPVTLTLEDFEKLREQMIQWIDQYRKVVEPSKPELLACLTLDWAKIRLK